MILNIIVLIWVVWDKPQVLFEKNISSIIFAGYHTLKNIFEVKNAEIII